MVKTMADWATLLNDVWENLDILKLVPYFSEDVEYIAGGPARGSRYAGKQAVTAAIHRAINEIFTISKTEVHDILIAKQHIIVLVYVEGNSRITGKEYANELLYTYKISNDKIVQQREYLDTIASARATGDLPSPD